MMQFPCRTSFRLLTLLALLICSSLPAHANAFAMLHGIVHDPQHRPIAGAEVTLKATNSDFTITAKTSSEGEFELPQVPIGVYSLKVSATGFAATAQSLTVASGTNPVIHIPLAVASATQTVVVEGLEPSASATDSVTPTTLITREDIELTPGADRTIGMEMITDYVPGAYMTHDMLHMRGGHQTSWLIDGVAIPNTKIASNVGPQIDPKDIDALETQRGSYASDIGDRTYGVFNVLPRNGFERSRDGEFILDGGNFGTGEAQLSLGDHNSTTAWYASAHRLPLQLRPRHARRRRLSRRHQLRKRLCLTHSQPDAQRPASPQRPVPPGLLRRSLRPQSQPTTNALPAITAPPACATLKPSATPSSSPTGFTPSRPRRCFPSRPSTTSTSRTTTPRPPTYPSPPPGIRPRTMLGGQADVASRRRPQQLLRRRLLLLSAGERSLRRAGQRRQRALRAQRHRPAPALRSSSSISPTICAWANTSPCSAASASPSSMAGTTRPPSIPASAQPLKFLACTGFCAASTATSSSPRRCSPSPDPCSTTPAVCPRAKTPSPLYPPSATRSTSSAFRFRTRAGFSTSIPSRTASTTSSTTPTSANPTCTSPSPSMAPWSAPGR